MVICIRSLEGVCHSIIKGGVELIRDFAAVGHCPHGDQPANLLYRLDHLLFFVFGQQPFGRAHADAIMAGREVEIGTAHWRRWHAALPLAQVLRVARHHCMQNQRRQREIIDRMRLIARPEIAEVFGLGHICFGQKDDLFRGKITEQSHQPDHRMGLG